MWCQVEATAAVPDQGCPLVRTKHAMCFTSDGHIYLYGGRSINNKALRDLWRFDTAQDQWEEVLPRSDASDCAPTKHHAALGRHADERHAHNSSRSSSSNSSAESFPLTPDNKFEPPPALQEHTMVAAKVSARSIQSIHYCYNKCHCRISCTYLEDKWATQATRLPCGFSTSVSL